MVMMMINIIIIMVNFVNDMINYNTVTMIIKYTIDKDNRLYLQHFCLKFLAIL